MGVASSWMSEETRSPGAEEAGRGYIVLRMQEGVGGLVKR